MIPFRLSHYRDCGLGKINKSNAIAIMLVTVPTGRYHKPRIIMISNPHFAQESFKRKQASIAIARIPYTMNKSLIMVERGSIPTEAAIN